MNAAVENPPPQELVKSVLTALYVMSNYKVTVHNDAGLALPDADVTKTLLLACQLIGVAYEVTQEEIMQRVAVAESQVRRLQ